MKTSLAAHRMDVIAPPVIKEELRALTGIRGLAAWFVVFYHARLLLTGFVPGWGIDMLAKGYLAVDFFFMLSGFVIGYNYSGKFMAQGLRASGPFLWRRFTRIWPLHAAILVAMIAFALILVATERDHSAYPFQELPLHFLLMQNWGFTRELSWNYPAWSISTEAGAYLLFPLFVVLVRPERRGTATLLAGVIALMAALYTVFRMAGWHGLGDDISGLGLFRCVTQFAVGVILCVLWQRWKGGRRWCASVTLVLAIVVLATGLGAGLPETAFVPAAMASGLMALALSRGWLAGFFGSRLIHWLGEISYSTYLAHFFLLVLFKIAFVDASLQMGPGKLAAYSLLLLGVSAALYYVVERPAQRWLMGHAPHFARVAPPR